jgi:group I intron endonuclease
MQAGIYKWTNLKTGRVLIGQTQDLKLRQQNYLSKLRRNTYTSNRHFQRSWNKHGEQNFIFETIELIEDIDQLTTREQFWLDHYRSLGLVYNQSGPVTVPYRGAKHSSEARAKMSINHKGMLGKHHSIETKLRMSLAKKGQPSNRKGFKHTEESKAKMSEAAKKRAREAKQE